MKKYELEANDINIHNSLIDDKIGNQEYLSSLIRLISNIDDNEVICIDGDWGVGKTFLVKQLIYLINHYNEDNNQEQFKLVEPEKDILINICNNNLVFYYNAWENDDHSDVLESIIYNILNEYPKYKNEVSSKFDKTEAIKEVLNILTKIVSSKLLNIDFSAEKIEKIKTFKDLSDEINTYEERKSLFEELVNKILVDKRMILVIDELDRCNPNFATKILEVIKHFYNLSNITVIIVSNNKELQNTIKQQYGQNFNSYTYLNRFFDYTMTIDNNRSIDYAKKYLEFRAETYLPHDVFYAMTQKYKFSLRDCNRYRVLYDTAVDYIENDNKRNFFFDKKENYCIYSIILPIIYTFKIKDINAYNQCINRQTKKLEEALYYLNDYFNKKGHGRWLLEFVDINKKYEDITDDEIINEISNTFIKVYNSGGIDKIFLKAIRVSI
jgi:KAP P-loop domain protein